MINEIKLKVDEIPCTGCAEDIEILLRDQAGILDVKINYANDIIEIQYDPELTDRPAVTHAVQRVANIRKVVYAGTIMAF